jgi:Cu/Ag efflux protein CusF
MSRGVPAWAAVVLAVAAATVQAQDGPQRGKVKKVDAAKGVITITADGKDQDYAVTDDTRIMDASNRPAKDGLKNEGFKEGAAVMFKAASKDGKPILVGLRLVGGAGQSEPAKADTAKLKPLTELGKEQYQGYEGGLYPDGKNERPAAHEAAGVALAKKVQPLDADGKPADDGSIVLLSVGMSNTTQEYSTFKRVADADKEKNPALVLVDGAQGGQPAAAIVNPDDNASGTRYWTTVDQRLKSAGVARAQVQAAWIKQADARPTQPFPKHAETLEKELGEIVRVLHDRFPNLKLVYLSSRTYGGYARTPLNPEPYAYESGFAVKWLIEKQLKGDAALNCDPDKGAVKAPWLSWGPYLWANGTTPRADGLTYEERDFRENDRTHPSASGQEKVAKQLLQFFKTDTTTKPWFVGR